MQPSKVFESRWNFEMTNSSPNHWSFLLMTREVRTSLLRRMVSFLTPEISVISKIIGTSLNSSSKTESFLQAKINCSGPCDNNSESMMCITCKWSWKSVAIKLSKSAHNVRRWPNCILNMLHGIVKLVKRGAEVSPVPFFNSVHHPIE